VQIFIFFNFSKLPVSTLHCCLPIVAQPNFSFLRSSFRRTRRSSASRCRTCRTCWRPPGSAPWSSFCKLSGILFLWRNRRRRDPWPWRLSRLWSLVRWTPRKTSGRRCRGPSPQTCSRCPLWKKKFINFLLN